MGYYGMRLNREGRKICTIVLPWGMYEYNVLPMGIVVATDISQSRLSQTFQHLDYALVYLDDLAIIGKSSFTAHLLQIRTVLTSLREKGMQVNPLKSFWAKPEINHLGFNLSRRGIKPDSNKIKKILAIKAPSNKKQLRRFIGILNYYKDMCIHRAHILQPIISMTFVDMKANLLSTNKSSRHPSSTFKI